MTSIGNMKPRRFVKEFQNRAGLLIDGIAGPQTQMALWLIPEPPMGGHWYQPVETTKADDLMKPASTTVHVPPTFATTPTPIDPADIRPGDVVERRERFTVTRVEDDAIFDDHGLSWDRDYPPQSWHLVHRPDPDAEAVQAIRSASYNIWHRGERMDPLPGLTESLDLLAKLREQGWDVVRRAES